MRQLLPTSKNAYESLVAPLFGVASMLRTIAGWLLVPDPAIVAVLLVLPTMSDAAARRNKMRGPSPGELHTFEVEPQTNRLAKPP